MSVAERVKERPIVFGAPMIRALLAGAKTRTRRAVKHAGDFLGGGGKANRGEWDDPNCWGWEDPENPSHFIVLGRNPDPGDVSVRCPYGVPGDRLWVKEAAYIAPPNFGEPGDGDRFDDEGRRRVVGYAATMGDEGVRCATDYGVRKTSPIFLPRWASRITLAVESVRVERLQAVTEEDAVAEGVDSVPMSAVRRQATFSRRADFAQLWDRINGKTSPWESNCWVWVVGFRVEA